MGLALTVLSMFAVSLPLHTLHTLLLLILHVQYWIVGLAARTLIYITYQSTEVRVSAGATLFNCTSHIVTTENGSLLSDACNWTHADCDEARPMNCAVVGNTSTPSMTGFLTELRLTWSGLHQHGGPQCIMSVRKSVESSYQAQMNHNFDLKRPASNPSLVHVISSVVCKALHVLITTSMHQGIVSTSIVVRTRGSLLGMMVSCLCSVELERDTGMIMFTQH